MTISSKSDMMALNEKGISMNIFNKVRKVTLSAVEAVAEGVELNLEAITVEAPRDPSHGDLSTNAAMVITKALKQNPRKIAELISAILKEEPYITEVNIAGPGFINLHIADSEWQEQVSQILAEGSNYGANNMGNNVKVNVEYVSANPTGPLHIGHARPAVYGDAMAKLLKVTGHEVVKEYYINDAGGQIDILADSLYLRYKQAATGEEPSIPEGLYPGSYLIPIGEKLFAKIGNKFLTQNRDEYIDFVKEFAIAEMMDLIRGNLKDLGIEHDVFFSEKSLHDSNKIAEAVAKLGKLEATYKGTLEAPKGKLPDDWEEREQLLFKSSEFGDDEDRALQKSDGSWTYFAADTAYLEDKIARGFNVIMMTLGVDHGGYVKRMNAAANVLSKGRVKSDIKLCQLVNYLKDGQPVKMSKRSGNFETVEDVVSLVGKDIVRFFMLTKKNDTLMDFDLTKVLEQSKDNPVFYVQYAYVRGKSILAKAKENTPAALAVFEQGAIDLSLLNSEQELQFIKFLASWPKLIEASALYAEPHRIAFFLQELAAKFHSIWNVGKEDGGMKFVMEDNLELTAARLGLVRSVMNIIEMGLDIMGVQPLEQM